MPKVVRHASWPNGGVLFTAGLGLFLVFHLAQAFLVPLGHDEAHYRIWSQNLQWGYYDHPPMVAWWIALGEFFLPPPAGTRLMTVLAHSATSVVLYGLLKEIGTGQETARRAALVYQAILICLTDGFLALTDVPLTFFWTLTLLLTVRAARGGTLWQWLLAGVSAGLALLSKYTGFLLIASIGPWILLCRRDLLFKAGPYLALAVTTVLIIPNILWNCQNDWVALAGQFGRILPEAANINGLPHIFQFEKNFTSVLLFITIIIAGCFILFNPVVSCFFILNLRKLFTDKYVITKSSDGLIVIITSVPLILLILYVSINSIGRATWAWPILPAIASLAVIRLGSIQNRGRIVFWSCLLLFSGIYMSGVYIWHFNILEIGRRSAIGISDTWPQFAQDVRSEAKRTGATWVGMAHYAPVSMLSSMKTLHDIQVLQLIERRRYPQGRQVWKNAINSKGIILLSRQGAYGTLSPLDAGGHTIDPEELSGCFGSVEHVGSIERDLGFLTEEYAVYLVSDPFRDTLVYGCTLPNYTPNIGGARYLREIQPQTSAEDSEKR